MKTVYVAALVFFSCLVATIADTTVTVYNTGSATVTTYSVYNNTVGSVNCGTGVSIAAGGNVVYTLPSGYGLFFKTCGGTCPANLVNCYGPSPGTGTDSVNLNGCTGAGPVTYYVSVCVTNDFSQYPESFSLNNCGGSGTLAGPVTVAPGGNQCITYATTNGNFNAQLYRSYNGTLAAFSGCVASSSTTGSPTTGGGGGFTGTPGGTNAVPNAPALSPLPTGSGGLTASQYSAGITQIVSVIAGGNTLLNGQLSTANSQLSTANGTLTGISNLDYRISTNSPGGSGTGDGPVTTNLLARAVSELAAVTNAVAMGETNRAPSMGDIPSSATNLSAAWTAGSNAVSSQLGTIDGYISGFGTEVTESTLTNGADASPFMIGSIDGIALNLDPDNLVPGLSTTTKAVWTLLLLIGFGYWAGKLLYDTALAFSAAQTGGVPNIEGEAAGFGGNILGVITAALIPLVIIGLWLAVLDRMLALIGSSCFAPGTIGAIISGFSVRPSGASTGTTKLLAHFASAWFPLHLALCLLLTGLLLQWGALKVVLITAAAQRFLFGK